MLRHTFRDAKWPGILLSIIFEEQIPPRQESLERKRCHMSRFLEFSHQSLRPCGVRMGTHPKAHWVDLVFTHPGTSNTELIRHICARDIRSSWQTRWIDTTYSPSPPKNNQYLRIFDNEGFVSNGAFCVMDLWPVIIDNDSCGAGPWSTDQGLVTNLLNVFGQPRDTSISWHMISLWTRYMEQLDVILERLTDRCSTLQYRWCGAFSL